MDAGGRQGILWEFAPHLARTAARLLFLSPLILLLTLTGRAVAGNLPDISALSFDLGILCPNWRYPEVGTYYGRSFNDIDPMGNGFATGIDYRVAHNWRIGVVYEPVTWKSCAVPTTLPNHCSSRDIWNIGYRTWALCGRYVFHSPWDRNNSFSLMTITLGAGYSSLEDAYISDSYYPKCIDLRGSFPSGFVELGYEIGPTNRGFFDGGMGLGYRIGETGKVAYSGYIGSQTVKGDTLCYPSGEETSFDLYALYVRLFIRVHPFARLKPRKG